MATPVIMPKQGQSVESCIISKWYKNKGDKVSKGDILFAYETDKASFEEEAPEDGILLDVFFEEGDDVPCLLNVCVIGQEGESTQGFNPNLQEEEPRAQETETAGAADNAPEVQTERRTAQSEVHAPVASDAAEIKISPRARNLADKFGLDIRYASPTGPYGRVIEQDIVSLRDSGPVLTPSAQAAAAGGVPVGVTGTGIGGRVTTSDLQAPASVGEPTVGKLVTPAAAAAVIADRQAPSSATWLVSDPGYDEVRVPNIRKVIAKAMHQSLATTAQLTLNTTFDATDLLAYRKKLKEAKDRLGLENITINDMILFAVSRTLLNHKDLNAHFLNDTVRHFHHVNLGNAVDTDRGLMVPTIFSADSLSLNEISRRAKQLASECKAGSINPDLLRNGSFTITNLGTLDIESFTPVLNPPQTGILGVNNIVQRAREVDGDCVFYPAMGLSLTFDHRAIDGAPAARFLKELKTNLESFSVMLVR